MRPVISGLLAYSFGEAGRSRPKSRSRAGTLRQAFARRGPDLAEDSLGFHLRPTRDTVYRKRGEATTEPEAKAIPES